MGTVTMILLGFVWFQLFVLSGVLKGLADDINRVTDIYVRWFEQDDREP